MWTKILINIIASNLTKEIVELLLDKIGDSLKNKASREDVDGLKAKL